VGTMGRASAPNDPIFWLLHANIDRLWVEWQRRHGQVYLPVEGAEPGHNLDDTMWPFRDIGLEITPRTMLDHRALGYTYDVELARPPFAPPRVQAPPADPPPGSGPALGGAPAWWGSLWAGHGH
jgi:tyrosinase